MGETPPTDFQVQSRAHHMMKKLTPILMAVLIADFGLVMAAEPRKSGEAITSFTKPFGSGSITRHSDGSKTTTRPFGTGTTSTTRTKNGATMSSTTKPFGSGSITRHSDGSKTTTRPFGTGTISTTTPARKK